MLFDSLSLWNETTFCIHWSPDAGLSGWMYIRFGISGSAFPATIQRLKKSKYSVNTGPLNCRAIQWGIYMCRSYIRLVPQPEKDWDQNGKRHAKPKFDNWYLIKFEAQTLHQFYYKLFCNSLMWIQFIIKYITCHSVCAYLKISQINISKLLYQVWILHIQAMNMLER